MGFTSQVKYSKVSGVDAGEFTQSSSSQMADQHGPGNFSYDSYFTYSNEADKPAKNNYSSVFNYSGLSSPGNTIRNSGHLSINVREEAAKINSSPELKCASHVITFVSYLFFALSLPISYWFFVKKLGEFERLVVFRLGKLIGVKGPGRVVIFPWMDRVKKIDVRAAAFSVPPQQFITCDGGIVEMGAEIQYGIVDIITMVSEVVDHQDILRSLSKSLLVKVLVKKTVSQLEKERKRPANEILDELNLQVRKWGMDVQKVELSDPKVLKQAENSSNAAVGTILKGLGMASEKKYPTPQEFVRLSHGIDEESSSSSSNSASLMQLLGDKFMSNMAPPPPPSFEPSAINWGSCLAMILKEEVTSPLEEDACGLYKMEITGGQNGTEFYFISLTSDTKKVLPATETGGVCPDGRSPDVTVTIASNDLASVLEGTLAPLQAYLSGRISASGDVRKLMLFDKLSNRGRKPGSMFNV